MRGLIRVRHRVGPSTVRGAGKGFFVEEGVSASKILIAPTHATHTVSLAEIFGPAPPAHSETSVVWFEDQCVVSPEYPDDFFINHSFSPNAVWHLGFVFALRNLTAGEELFLDYRHLVAPGVALDFVDGATGEPIVGHDWKTSLAITARQVLALVESAD